MPNSFITLVFYVGMHTDIDPEAIYLRLFDTNKGFILYYFSSNIRISSTLIRLLFSASV